MHSPTGKVTQRGGERRREKEKERIIVAGEILEGGEEGGTQGGTKVVRTRARAHTHTHTHTHTQIHSHTHTYTHTCTHTIRMLFFTSRHEEFHDQAERFEVASR